MRGYYVIHISLRHSYSLYILRFKIFNIFRVLEFSVYSVYFRVFFVCSAIPFLLSHIPPFRPIESPLKTSLKLDGSGTEILVIVSCQQLAVVSIDNIQVGSSDNRA